jgi:hypothetical protein
MQFIFGAGEFYAKPLTDAQGVAIAVPTPIRIGTLQEMSLEFSTDLKELHGQYQFAVDVARGKGKVGGKIKGAQINGRALNSLFFGSTQTDGTLMNIYSDTTGTAIPSTPYTITPTVPNSGDFEADMGVLDENGVPMVRVASSPAAGQYSVNESTGVYTFAAADTTNVVFINFKYSYTLAAAKKLSVTNQLMGASPLIEAYLKVSYRGKSALVLLHSAIFTKLALFGTKVDDYSIPDMDFGAFANGANQIADIWVSE